MDNPPDFSKQLNQDNFTIKGAAGYRAGLDQSRKDIAGVNNDWTAVNDLLDQQAAGQTKADARASGEGLTGAAEVRFGQQDLGTNDGSAQGLGQALMRLGSKASAQQSLQAGQAEQAQQQQALQQATALRLQAAEQKRQMFKADMQLDNQKFAMGRAAKQAQDGLDLAQTHLTNMFNQAVAGAKNSQELAQVQVNQQNFAQTMMYLQAGIGAASTAASAAAAVSASGALRDDSSSGEFDLAPQGTNRYGGLTSSTNYKSSGFGAPSVDLAGMQHAYMGAAAPGAGSGPNSLGAVQSFFNQKAPI